MNWICLSVAIVFEVAATSCLKLSAGFTKLAPSLLMVLFYCISFGFLSVALKKIDVGVAYAIWSGVGTALISAIGIVYFREPLTAMKLGGTLAIIGGVIALNLAGGAH
jgi:small multidrug resistance pump